MRLLRGRQLPGLRVILTVEEQWWKVTLRREYHWFRGTWRKSGGGLVWDEQKKRNLDDLLLEWFRQEPPKLLAIRLMMGEFPVIDRITRLLVTEKEESEKKKAGLRGR